MPGILVPFLEQIVGDVVPVTERLDALAPGIGLTLVGDEKPFKIFLLYIFYDFNGYSAKVDTSNGLGNMSVLDAYFMNYSQDGSVTSFVNKALPMIAVWTTSKYEATFFACRIVIFLLYDRTI